MIWYCYFDISYPSWFGWPQKLWRKLEPGPGLRKTVIGYHSCVVNWHLRHGSFRWLFSECQKGFLNTAIADMLHLEKLLIWKTGASGIYWYMSFSVSCKERIYLTLLFPFSKPKFEVLWNHVEIFWWDEETKTKEIKYTNSCRSLCSSHKSYQWTDLLQIRL